MHWLSRVRPRFVHAVGWFGLTSSSHDEDTKVKSVAKIFAPYTLQHYAVSCNGHGQTTCRTDGQADRQTEKEIERQIGIAAHIARRTHTHTHRTRRGPLWPHCSMRSKQELINFHYERARTEIHLYISTFICRYVSGRKMEEGRGSSIASIVITGMLSLLLLLLLLPWRVYEN